MHMAIGAVVNALWDLKAKRAGLPLWQLLSSMTPGGDRSTWSTSATSPTRSPRTRRWRSCARPSPAASERDRPAAGATATRPTRRRPGWLGYSDEKLVRLCPRGRRRRLHPDQAQGRRRPRRRHPASAHRPRRRSARTSRSPIDANQRWDVADAIAWVQRARSRSTSPGSRSRPAPTTSSATPPSAASRRVPVATGEHVAEPGDVQAAAAGRGDRRHADRRGPGRRRQREHRDPAAGRQVRRPGLPARRRRRAVRGRAAPVDVRLRRRLRHAGTTASSSSSTTCTSTSWTRYGSSTAATWRRGRPAPAPRCTPTPLERVPLSRPLRADHDGAPAAGRRTLGVLHRTTVSACSSTSVCTPSPAATSGCRTASASTRRRTRSTSSTSTPISSTPPTGPGSARRAGMRYAVLTTKHHEGFCLWDSALQRLQDHQHAVRPRPGRRVRRGVPGRGDQDRLLPLADRLAPSRLRRRRPPPAAGRAGSSTQLNAGRDMARYRDVPARPGARAADALRRDRLPVLRLLLPRAPARRRSSTTRARTTGARSS